MFPLLSKLLAVYHQLDRIIAEVGQEFLNLWVKFDSGERAGSKRIQDGLGEKAVG